MNINIKIQNIINNKPKTCSFLFNANEVNQCCGHIGFYCFPFDKQFRIQNAKNIIYNIKSKLSDYHKQKLFTATTLVSQQKTASYTFRYLASEIIKFKGSTNTNLELYIMHRKDLVNKLKGEKFNDPAQI